MYFPIINLSILFFSYLAMAAAMTIAWGSFGRRRYVMTWAAAYGLAAAGIFCGSITLIVPTIQPYWWPFYALLVILSAALLAVAARQRIGQPTLRNRITLASIATFATLLVCHAVKALWPLREVLANLFTIAMLFLAIAATRPKSRRADPAERAMLAALILYALLEAGLVLLRLDTVSHPSDVTARHRYFITYFIALPSTLIANGMAMMLLAAADLAARLRRLAARDPLTGIHNRRGFREAAERTIANGRRHHVAITVVTADIDHFKAINDRFGHTAGDQTLTYIARMLREGIRQGDIVGRIGGEEFALLLVDSTAAQAVEAMDRIREEIAAGFSNDQAPVPVTTSFGIAEVQDNNTAREMLSRALERADRALYRSKISGRNRVVSAPS